MKACAADYASRGEHVGRFRAEAIVIRFMQDARVSPWPPPAVVDFFANELLSMIEQAREHKTEASPQAASG